MILDQLLRAVAEGGIHSHADLARRLSISESLLGAMLEDLARLGYLKPVTAPCREGCHGCSRGACALSGSGPVLTLTQKGATAARKLSP